MEIPNRILVPYMKFMEHMLVYNTILGGLGHLCFHEALVERSSPFGGEIPHGMVAGHCLAPFGLASFGLGSLPAAMLLGCWPLSCSL